MLHHSESASVEPEEPMLDEERPQRKDFISFGPFRFFATQRLLEKDGVPLNLGSRALDLLIALVERATEVVSKRELMARVWPNLVVDEGSLRFHIASLRKVLGDGQSGVRYVTNVAGRGYCFVAPIRRSAASPSRTKNFVADRTAKLPVRLLRMVGRDETVQAASELLGQRFVTIVGPGGVGKTTVAVSVAHAKCSEFGGAIHFVDLEALDEPSLVPRAIASTLGLPVNSDSPIQDLLSFVRDQRMLLVLDNCEHVIETAAPLAESIFNEAPQVHILATSRESLRVEGERVYRLPPLRCPPEVAVGLTAAEVMSFPAVRLFVERVIASGVPFVLSDADAPIVAELCRGLDGIALALELAASHVAALGVRGTAALLDSQFRFLWQGRRTAPPRHQTLGATLDWSHNLLSDFERLVLRRLAVFVGSFSLEAAQSVAAGNPVDGGQVVEAVASLVAKSLVATEIGATLVRYRLLDTTRAYALGKLVRSGEAAAVGLRHATYYRELFERTDFNRFAVIEAQRGETSSTGR